jgi:hypothetical protein
MGEFSNMRIIALGDITRNFTRCYFFFRFHFPVSRSITVLIFTLVAHPPGFCAVLTLKKIKADDDGCVSVYLIS